MDEITVFQIVDLGVAPVGTFDGWGLGHRSIFDADVLGEGPTAKAAMECALNELALAGHSTRLLHEASIEEGYHAPDANQTAAELWREDVEGEEDEDADEEVLYYVGIRYQLPDDGEDEGEPLDV